MKNYELLPYSKVFQIIFIISHVINSNMSCHFFLEKLIVQMTYVKSLLKCGQILTNITFIVSLFMFTLNTRV